MSSADKTEILEAIQQLLGATTSYFEKTDRRLARIERRLDLIEDRLTSLETRVTSLEGRMRGLELRMDRLEDSVGSGFASVNARLQRLEAA